jgi:hypothetical protein
MKIVFVEVRGGQEFGRREFEQTVIVAGRDPAVCDILFDQTEWPMVSRRHGEFRLVDGEWRLSDNKSSSRATRFSTLGPQAARVCRSSFAAKGDAGATSADTTGPLAARADHAGR